MEFEHVGLHCEAPGCGQKDFLPFHCDCCNLTLCLDHRSYTAHSCTAAGMKDMHSVECPMCLKSIKFDMSKDVNEVWEQHYLNGCIPSAAPAAKKTCAKRTCNTVIGPSNGFKCPKCAQIVCLSHRNPEDHECKVVPTKSSWLDKVEQSNTKPKSVPAKKPAVVKATKPDDGNTLKGTAARRMQGSEPTAAPVTVFAAPTAPKDNYTPAVCPFCDYIDSSANSQAELLSHIAIHHPDNGSGSGSHHTSQPHPVAAVPVAAARSNATANPALGREVCPVCNARFMDATSLVMHFESAHPSGPAHRSTNTAHSHSSTDNANCQLC